MNRAALYLELGKDDLARIDYSLVLDIESDNQEALLMRAYIYMRQRNYNFAKSGPGTAFDFGFYLVKTLAGAAREQEVRHGTYYR